MQLSDSLLQKSYPIHLLIYPETAINMISLDINADMNLEPFDNLLIKNNTALLTGIVRVYFYKDNENIPITAKKIPDDTDV
jgi:hypothetical protein